MGELGAKIVADTFKRLRDADRFYFEWALPAGVVQEIKATSLGDVIKRNTFLQNVPDNTFKVLKSGSGSNLQTQGSVTSQMSNFFF